MASTRVGSKERGKKKKGSKEKKKRAEIKQAPQPESLPRVAHKEDVSLAGASATQAITSYSRKSGGKERNGRKKKGSKERIKRAEREQGPPMKPLPQVVQSKKVPPREFNVGIKKKTKQKVNKETFVEKKMEEQSGDVPFPEALPLKAPPLDDLLVEPQADTARRKGSPENTNEEKKNVGIPLSPEPPPFYSSPSARLGEAQTAERKLTIPKKKTKGKEKKLKITKMNKMESLPENGVPPQERLPGAPLVEHTTAGKEMVQEHYDRRSKKKMGGTKQQRYGTSPAGSPQPRLGKAVRLKSDPTLDEDLATQTLATADESKYSNRKTKKKVKGGADLKHLFQDEAISQQATKEQGLTAATLPLGMPPGNVRAKVAELGAEKRTRKQQKTKLAGLIPLKLIPSVDKKSNQKEKKRPKKKKGDTTPEERTPPEGILEELSSLSETFQGEENESKRKENFVPTEPEVVDRRAEKKGRRTNKSKTPPLEHSPLVPTSSICSVCGLHSTEGPSPGTAAYTTPRFKPTADPGALNYILNAITKYCARTSKTGDHSARDLSFTIVGPSPLGPAGSTVRVIRGSNSPAQMTRSAISRPPGRDIQATRSTVSTASRERRGASCKKKRAIQRRFIDMMPGTESTINIPRRRGSMVINVRYPDEPIVPDMTSAESDVSFVPPSRSYSWSRAPTCPDSTYCEDETIMSGHLPYNNYSRSYYRIEPSEFTCECGESLLADESAFTEYPPDRYQLPSKVPCEELSFPLKSHAVPSLTTEIPPTLQIVMESTLSVSEIEDQGLPDALTTVHLVKEHRKLRKQEGRSDNRKLLLPRDLIKKEQQQEKQKTDAQDMKQTEQIKKGGPKTQQIHELLQVLQQPQLTLQPPEQQIQLSTQQPQRIPSPLGLRVKKALQQEQRELLAQILQTQTLPQVQPQQYRQQTMTMPQEQPQWQQLILQSSLLPQEKLLQQPGPQSQTLPHHFSNASPLLQPTQQERPHLQFPAMPTVQLLHYQQQVLPLNQQQLHLGHTKQLRQLLQVPTQTYQQNPEYAQPQVMHQRLSPFDHQCLLELQQELKQELQKQGNLQLYQRQQQTQVPQWQSWPQNRSNLLLIHQQLQPNEYLESIAVDGQPIYNQIYPPPGVMQQLPPPIPQQPQPGSLQLAPKMQPPPAHTQRFQPILVPMQYPKIPFQRP